MDTALEQLSKTQLIALVKKGEEAVAERDRVIREKETYESQLLAMIEKFKRMAFAQKRERFEGNKDQLALPFGEDETQQDKLLFSSIGIVGGGAALASLSEGGGTPNGVTEGVSYQKMTLPQSEIRDF